jgi:hypothetical protein
MGSAGLKGFIWPVRAFSQPASCCGLQPGAQVVAHGMLDGGGDDPRELGFRFAAGQLGALRQDGRDVPVTGIADLGPHLAHALPVDPEIGPRERLGVR